MRANLNMEAQLYCTVDVDPPCIQTQEIANFPKVAVRPWASPKTEQSENFLIRGIGRRNKMGT